MITRYRNIYYYTDTKETCDLAALTTKRVFRPTGRWFAATTASSKNTGTDSLELRNYVLLVPRDGTITGIVLATRIVNPNGH